MSVYLGEFDLRSQPVVAPEPGPIAVIITALAAAALTTLVLVGALVLLT